MTVSITEIPYQPDSAIIFKALAHEDWPVWLDSGQQFRDHQIDVLAANPLRKLIHDPQNTHPPEADTLSPHRLSDAFEEIQTALTQYRHQQPQGPGWLGYLSYDLFDEFESVARRDKASLIPGLMMGFYGVIVVSYHQLQKTVIYSLPQQQEWANRLQKRLAMPTANIDPLPPFALTSRFSAITRRGDYQQQFQRIKDYIHSGDCYQVNLTQQFTAQCTGAATRAYLALRTAHPSPMSAFFRPGDFEILSLSPERFVRKEGDRLATYPIKGTRPRSQNGQQDQALKQALQASLKDRAENVMIVDLLRNDLGRICETGSIQTTQLFNIESFPNVHHLVSVIEGQLRGEVCLQKLFRAIFPGGSITGAPKVRAMEIIEELEEHRRGIYCGSMAFFCGNGDFDSNIAIRTLLRRKDEIHCWGGGGVVADSECDNEYQETLDKVGRLMAILEENFGNQWGYKH